MGWLVGTGDSVGWLVGACDSVGWFVGTDVGRFEGSLLLCDISTCCIIRKIPIRMDLDEMFKHDFIVILFFFYDSN